MKINVIIPCGGSGSRAGLGYNKLLYDIGGMKLIEKTVSRFCLPEIAGIILPVAETDRAAFEALFDNSHLPVVLCAGGETRARSVYNALAFTDADCDYIVVHDGARPFLSAELLARALRCAEVRGNAVAAIPVSDSIRQRRASRSEAVPRENYCLVQTPQIFPADKLREAYARAKDILDEYTDDASLYEAQVGEVFLCEGEAQNVKLTEEADFTRFFPEGTRVGNGWDTHRLEEDRRLVLGGLDIPHDKGLLGHSDADVLTHALMDAILSACDAGDIGAHFPDTDAQYRDISSLLLLERVRDIAAARGYRVVNAAAVIMAQRPKLAPYLDAMAKKLATVLQIDSARVSLTATTTEKLGMTGREEGISVSAVCLLKKS